MLRPKEPPPPDYRNWMIVFIVSLVIGLGVYSFNQYPKEIAAVKKKVWQQFGLWVTGVGKSSVRKIPSSGSAGEDDFYEQEFSSEIFEGKPESDQTPCEKLMARSSDFALVDVKKGVSGSIWDVAECFILYRDASRAEALIKTRLQKSGYKLSDRALLLYLHSLSQKGQDERALAFFSTKCSRWKPTASCVAKFSSLVGLERYIPVRQAFHKFKKMVSRMSPQVRSEFWRAAGEWAIRENEFSKAESRLDDAFIGLKTKHGWLENTLLEWQALLGVLWLQGDIGRRAYDRQKTLLAQESPSLRRLVSLYLTGISDAKSSAASMVRFLTGSQFNEPYRGQKNAMLGVGVISLRKGLYEEFESFLAKSVDQMTRKYQSGKAALKRLRQWSIRSQLGAGSYQEAQHSLAQYRKFFAQDIFYHHFYGSVLYAGARDSRTRLQAAQEFNKALRAGAPWNSRYGIVVSLLGAGKLPAAAKELAKLKKGKSIPRKLVWTNLAILEEQLVKGRSKQAVPHLLAMRKKYPGNTQVWRLLRKAYSNLKEDKKKQSVNEGMRMRGMLRKPWLGPGNSSAPLGPLALSPTR